MTRMPAIGRRTLLGLGAGGTALALLPRSAEAAPRLGGVLARDLVVPWGLAFLPNGDALVGERVTGRIYRVRKGGGKRLVGRIPVEGTGEGGLLGLAVHPKFAQGRNWVYAYVTTATDNRIVRMRFARNRLGRRRLVLAPTGKVPRRNPFGNHVWSLGHRNVQGLVFDDKGRLWASEFGASSFDEMNRIVKGGNYGWPQAEGFGGPGRRPFVTWPTSECSPSGIATAKGWAYVGALRGRSLWAVRLNGRRAGRKVRLFEDRLGRIRTVERAPDGSLWITTSNRDGRGTPGPADDRVVRVRL